MNVLMATDGSRHANTAILTALRLLRPADLSVDVLYVAPELVRAAAAHSETAQRARKAYSSEVKREGVRILVAAERLLHREAVRPNVTLRLGSAVEVILQAAHDYDLVVAGAHGRFERTQPGLGPVANRLVENSPSSVFVGRDLTSDKNFRVLVAIDGSEASFKALHAMASFLDCEAIDVTLMHVVESPWARLDLAPQSAEYESDASAISDYRNELEHELRRYADRTMVRARNYLEALNVPATEIIEEGDPALELVSHAEAGGYDLIVAGATGNSDVKHALLGSVSSRLAWNAPCSVLVVRA
jgi:nucleotide-binding universal stress UspA family protein